MESDAVDIRECCPRWNPMFDDVLPVKEIATFLQLAEKTVSVMPQAGEISAFKIRRQWRIKRTEFDQWIDVQPRGGDGGCDGD